MKVYKAGEVCEGELILSVPTDKRFDIISTLTNLQPAVDSNPSSAWRVGIDIGKGAERKNILLDLPPVFSQSLSLNEPIFFANFKFVFFRNRLFISERAPRNSSEREEIVLRIKKYVYDEEIELTSLRAAVANLEAAVEYKKSGPKRDPIPEDVKLVVWSRDGGACMRCGSKSNLHFDHINPVAKGGGNSEDNIQILCQTCNLKKSDKIAN